MRNVNEIYNYLWGLNKRLCCLEQGTDGVNIYNTDGTLTSPRTLTGSVNNPLVLNFPDGAGGMTELEFSAGDIFMQNTYTDGAYTNIELFNVIDLRGFNGTDSDMILSISGVQFRVWSNYSGDKFIINPGTQDIILPDYPDAAGDQVLATDENGKLILKTVGGGSIPYENGTWNPAMSVDEFSGWTLLNSSDTTWTKIGNIVAIKGTVTLERAVGSPGASSVPITGFPESLGIFTGSFYFVSGAVGVDATGTFFSGVDAASLSKISFYNAGFGAAAAGAQVTIAFSATYEVEVVS